jgi:ABC-2 type transport system permease protein
MRRGRMLAYVRAMLAAAEVTYRFQLVDGFVIFGIFIQPLIIALLGLWMLRGHGGDYAIFVVVGSGMTGLWSSLLFMSGNSITQERWTGTLESLVGVPTPIWIVVLGKNLANVTQSLGSMLASYLLASLLFGYPLGVAQPLPFAVSLLLTIFTFIAFGLVISPIFVLNPDVQRWQNGLEFPVYILSGFMFPIALLPGWTTPFSYLLAPYWAARALHLTSSGSGNSGQLLFCWAMMLVFSLLYLLISRWLFRLMLRKARVDATLSAL